MTHLTGVTTGTVEEQRSNIQTLCDRVGEETKKTKRLNKEKDDLEKVRKEGTTHNSKPVILCHNRKRLKQSFLLRV